jgi:small subunit ribosomal protein S3
MSVVKHFVTDSVKRTEIDEFLQQRLERAGYGGVTISKTPLGTHVVIYVMRPGLVIGRGGETIRELAAILEEKFKVSNPQISVSEIEIPEMNAYVVASRVTSALQRGIHFRRAGFWALNQVMDAGALGAEIVISGKLRTERARFEKFRAGYLPKTGDAALKYMRKAAVHIQLKPGMFGVRVRIMPPDAQFPDRIQIIETPPTEEEKPEETTETPEAAEAAETTTEAAKTTEATEATPTETAEKQPEPEPEEQEETVDEEEQETE